MVLNEPETSLHPDLLAPLATMIRAAAVTQVVVVTHSGAMRERLDTEADFSEIELYKEWGETRVTGQTMLTAPPWDWGER